MGEKDRYVEHFSQAWQKWMVRGWGYKPSKPALQLMVLETRLGIHRQQSAIETSNIWHGNCRQVPSSTSSIHREPLEESGGWGWGVEGDGEAGKWLGDAPTRFRASVAWAGG